MYKKFLLLEATVLMTFCKAGGKGSPSTEGIAAFGK
jgi:hypothetical protein